MPKCLSLNLRRSDRKSTGRRNSLPVTKNTTHDSQPKSTQKNIKRKENICRGATYSL